jgi:hypothetical protein
VLNPQVEATTASPLITTNIQQSEPTTTPKKPGRPRLVRTKKTEVESNSAIESQPEDLSKSIKAVSIHL